MPTQVDLGNQVQGILPLRYGGVGNELGNAVGRVLLPFMNDTGATLTIGTVVKRTASYGDTRVTPTTASTDVPVGVVVGRFIEGGELVEEVDAAHQDTVAVCVLGRCLVSTSAAVTQGQYLIPSSTSGAASGSTLVTQRAFGVIEYTTSGAGLVAAILTGFSAAPTTDVYYTINFLISAGGAAAPLTGNQGAVSIDAPGTIVSARMLAFSSGSAVVDIEKATYSGWPTTASICGAQKPTLSGASKSEDTTLSGWTTSLAAGDILLFQLDSISGIFVVTCALKVRRS